MYRVFCYPVVLACLFYLAPNEIRTTQAAYAEPIAIPVSTFENKSDDSGQDVKPWNQIDVLVLKQLEKKGLKPASVCSDSVFLRRVYLDLLGRIPQPFEINEFLKDTAKDKRARMIDSLLADERFYDYQTMKWADLLRIKSEFPINLWPNGAVVYHRWVREQLRNHVPYDQFARELLTASGSNFRCGPANFYRAVASRDALSYAEAVGSVFLDISTDTLSESQRNDLSQFFSRVAIKGTAQWKEEIVYWNRQPIESGKVVFPDGTTDAIKSDQDPRAVFAQWLTKSDNSFFKTCVVNRIWFWLFGSEIGSGSQNRIGMKNSMSGMTPGDEPLVPGLLEYLGNELVRNNFDLLSVYRLILNSRTYQQSSLQKEYRADSQKYFAVYPIRRIEAEVLQDIFIQIFNLQITYVSETPEPYAYIPSRQQTVQLGDAGITNSFLEMFGRATRDTGMESDRNNDITASQELFFINSNEINQWVQRKVRQTVAGGKSSQKGAGQLQQQLRFLWLSIISRPPSQQELDYAVALLKSGKNKNQVAEDLVWSLLNSKEFLCRH
ncbi:MAG: DUF1553 domain-containing protein [Thermoguttaceae bacterium]|nr:DUF1553 domain-containing protein [Thermoguttaceae bacterium]